jgi:hypothetical protein
MRRKLNETREKLFEIESKIQARRISANFHQMLADAKLNRSITHSPNNVLSEKDSVSPKRQVLKQARISDSSKSFAVSTMLEETPQVNVNKRQSHQKKPTNVLQAFSATRNNRQMNDISRDSTPTRRIKNTPQVSSVLRVVQNTPSIMVIEEEIKMDPMHGPVQLSSIADLKWAQQLDPIVESSVVMRVPVWNPLPENYFDHHGPTAELKKSESHIKAGRLYLIDMTIYGFLEVCLVQTINKFDGDMALVRKNIPEIGNQKVREQIERLVEHYTHNADFYNDMIKKEYDRRHVENERFIEDIKNQIKSVMNDLMGSV